MCPDPEERITPAAPGPTAEETRAHVPVPAPDELAPTPMLKVAASLGFIVAGLALPVVVALGGPWGGWVLGFALWAVNWFVATVTTKRAMASSPAMAVGMSGISFVVRAWTIAIILFIVALKYSEPAALAAAGTFLAAFTADLVGRGVIYAAIHKPAAAAAVTDPGAAAPTTPEDE